MVFYTHIIITLKYNYLLYCIDYTTLITMELLLSTILNHLKSLSQSLYLKKDILSFLGVVISNRFSS